MTSPTMMPAEATPTRWRGHGKSPTPGCGPVQLEIGESTLLRRRLRQFVEDSGLPQGDFSTFVFGASETTVYHYLKGGTIPRGRNTFLRHVEAIQREGPYVHITVRITESPRWDAMHKRRARNQTSSRMLPVPTPAEAVAEGDLVDRLNQDLGRFAKAQRVREYARAIQAQTGEVQTSSSVSGAWVLWLQRYADAIDPSRNLDLIPPGVQPIDIEPITSTSQTEVRGEDIIAGIRERANARRRNGDY